MKHKIYFLIIIAAFFLSSCSSPGPTTTNSSNKPTSTVTTNAITIFINNQLFSIPTDKISESSFVLPDPQHQGLFKSTSASATWTELLTQLNIEISYTCIKLPTTNRLCSDQNHSLKFFLNNARSYTVLDQTINDHDKLMISFGSESGIDLERQLNNQPKP